MFTFILSFAIASILAIVLHGSTRRFVRNRLRYVDAVQKGIAPWAAGGAVFVLGALVFPVLPIISTVIGMGTALTAGLAVATGVAAGAKDIRQGTTPIVYGR